MSIKLMSFVWDLASLPMGRKLVLLSLADQANDSGQCFPSFATLEKRCGMSRRTLFDCLRDLEEGGYISRIQVGHPGRQKIVFQVNEEALRQGELLADEAPKTSRATGAKSAPVQNLHQREICTGAKNDNPPVRNLHPIKQPSNSNPKEREQRSPSGSRLPLDWQPSAEDLAFAKAERPDLVASAEAGKFRDYWHGLPGARGRKTDWPATWRNWIRRADLPKGWVAPAATPTSTPKPPRDIKASPEAPLARALSYIRQQYDLGAYGEGAKADAERDRLIEEAKAKHEPEVTA